MKGRRKKTRNDSLTAFGLRTIRWEKKEVNMEKRARENQTLVPKLWLVDFISSVGLDMSVRDSRGTARQRASPRQDTIGK